MNTRTNIVLDDEPTAQSKVRTKVTTRKAAVEAALKAYVRKPHYSGLLALQGKGVIDPDYDPRGPYGLTQAAIERRGLKTVDYARIAHARQSANVQRPAGKSAPTGVSPRREVPRKPAVRKARADCLVAACAIEAGVPLLARNRDVRQIALIEPKLKLIQ